jgi:hypothetical protein
MTKLDKNYSIIRTEHSVDLIYENKTGKINPKTGREVISKDRTYHGTLQQALASYVSKVANINDDIKELIKSINNATELISKTKFQ